MPDNDEPPELPDRKSPARHPWQWNNNQPIILFLTVCTHKRLPILASPEVHKLLLASWKAADQWVVGRYVVMPDHVHLFASLNHFESVEVQKWVAYWKSLVTRSWPFEKKGPIWQRDVWDRQLRSGDSYESKWQYVVANPVRHGLVGKAEDWPYQGECYSLAWRGG